MLSVNFDTPPQIYTFICIINVFEISQFQICFLNIYVRQIAISQYTIQNRTGQGICVNKWRFTAQAPNRHRVQSKLNKTAVGSYLYPKCNGIFW